MDKTAEAFARKGSCLSFTNNLFFDFFELLIKDKNYADWFNGGTGREIKPAGSTNIGNHICDILFVPC